jgi:lipopolysaccharide/colanic/teichoic acid biosynthesis glycosyltransferase
MHRRLFDLALLFPTLPFFVPLIATLALAVWLADGRPVFFTQPRVGKRRRPFRIFKLRTMTTEAEVAQRRPTRLGAWLRAHALDELPQLLNVLVGDMALVGPRPLEPKDVERLTAQLPVFAERFAVKPGLGGPAQVAQCIGLDATAELEAEYARHASVAFDVRILLQSAWICVVGKRRGKKRIEVPGRAKCQHEHTVPSAPDVATHAARLDRAATLSRADAPPAPPSAHDAPNDASLGVHHGAG